MSPFIYSIYLFTLFILSNGLEGPICEKIESYTVDIKVPSTIEFKVKTFKWCFNPPTFRCKSTRNSFRTTYKVEEKILQKSVNSCCAGYLNVSNVCKPICSQPCVHGVCAGPELCDCQPGWNGTACHSRCERGKWGPKCGNKCECFNGATCDHVNGQCLCTSGFYGEDCSFLCNCPSEDYICNSTVGCVCKFGFSGVNCSYPDPNINSIAYGIKKVDEGYAKSSNNVVGIGIFCLIVILVIALCTFFILKYKTKVNKLKNELNYVTYAVETPPDRFENPIYSYSSPTSSTVKVDNAECSFNIEPICLNNDLTCKNNIEKAKLQELESGVMAACKSIEEDNLDSNCQGKDSEYNPNIYNSIDDFKIFSDKEPIYDEIKPKPELESEEEYDHLEYDRPKLSNSVSDNSKLEKDLESAES